MKEIFVKVPYVSVWDGGREIVTSANLDIRTGEVTEIKLVDPPNDLQTCEREYIILSDEQYDILTDVGEGYWIQLHSGHVGPCTEDYLAHREAMAGLSITHIIRAVDYISTLSQFLEKDNEILDDMNSVLEPLNAVINELRTEEICGHCGCDSFLYKSDLPQYDCVCPECDENW